MSFPTAQSDTADNTDGANAYHLGTKYRFPIFAGFADVGGGTFSLGYENYTITAATIQGLSCTPGGLIKNAPGVAPGNSHLLWSSYGTTLVGNESFPLLLAQLGYANSADNIDIIYDSSQGSTVGTSTDYADPELMRESTGGSGNAANNFFVAGLYHRLNDQFTNNFGWIHNSPESDEGGTDRPQEWPDELQGNSDTRFILAVPDGGTGTHNYGLSVVTDFRPAGNTEGTHYGTLDITNSYGATKTYVISLMDTAGACNSFTKRTLFKIDSLA